MTRTPGDIKDDRTTSDSIDWFMRSFGDESKIPPEQRAEWDAWSSDPSHAEEFGRAQQLWNRLGHPAAMERLAASGSADPGKASSAYLTGVEHTSRGKRFSHFIPPVRHIAVAASLVLLIALGFLRYVPQRYHWSISSGLVRTYSTDSSETEAVDLSDGSRITLGASTQLSVDYSATRRVIVLKRGEAMFRAAHDRTRPFVVQAGAGSITAVGTQFDVRREIDDADRVTVTVSAGAVEVVPPTMSPSNSEGTASVPGPVTWTPARLVRGQEMTFDRAGLKKQVAVVDLDAASAWVNGRLEYRQTPLKFVIPRVSRYSRKAIVLADDSAGELPFSGVVFAGQIDEWLRALQTAYPVEIRETADRFIISSRPDNSRP